MNLPNFKKYLIKHREHGGITDGTWNEICRDTEMTDRQLRMTIVKRLFTCIDDNIEKTKQLKELELEITKLKSDLRTLRERVEVSDYELNRARVDNGVKIAKKPKASREVIMAMREKGLTYEQIATELGVSRTTVWRNIR